MSTAAPARPSATRAIPVRRLDVGLAESVLPRWTVDDDPILSHFTSTLSAVFPRGEEFFVQTVRDHRHVAADEPVLKAQVKAFAGQEAMHGRSHRALNESLHRLGYRTRKADRDIGRILDVIYRFRPSTIPLAVTAGSEHLTGILAERALGHDETRAVLFSHPDLEALIAWHAVEELEHKNVAFDVLARTGAGYPTRIAGYGIAIGLLGGYVLIATIGSSLRDRRHIGPRQLRRFVRDFRRQELLGWRSLGQALQYLRPGFHPDDMDTDALVQAWRKQIAATTTVTAGMKSA